jgi:hypothetical protein
LYKIQLNIQEKDYIDVSGPLLLPMGRKEYLLKIRDEFSVYSWDYFMAENNVKQDSSVTEFTQCNIPWLSMQGLLRDLPGTVEIVLSCLSSVQ